MLLFAGVTLEVVLVVVLGLWEFSRNVSSVFFLGSIVFLLHLFAFDVQVLLFGFLRCPNAFACNSRAFCVLFEFSRCFCASP